ncbi:hypothetical protein J2S17_000164 [Cytobacillus purgationiresistens]|uniref:DUF3953 domain-containing protein n=1 Tax=Cytobacillus purgationiresistens TaxID=863449 RepID=A0ABU0ADW2_9BACI|nr:hypothetical protein [Cytobacillus purgationiresistens]
MGLSFQKSEKKSMTSINFLRTLIIIATVLLLGLAIMNHMDFFYIKYIFILSGFSSLVSGLESLYLRERKGIYLVELSLAMIWFYAGFILWQ